MPILEALQRKWLLMREMRVVTSKLVRGNGTWWGVVGRRSARLLAPPIKSLISASGGFKTPTCLLLPKGLIAAKAEELVPIHDVQSYM